MNLIQRLCFLLLVLGISACSPIPAKQVFLIDNANAPVIDATFSIPKRTEQEGLFWGFSFSPDGTRLLTSESGGEYSYTHPEVWSALIVWDLPPLQGKGTPIAMAKGTFWGNAWSHDGRWMAACEQRSRTRDVGVNQVHLFDGMTRREIRTIPAEDGLQPDMITFSRDGTYMLWTEVNISTAKSQVRVMSLKTNQIANGEGYGWSFRDDPPFISADNRRVIWLSVTWDLSDAPQLMLTGRKSYVDRMLQAFAVSPDGTRGYTVDARYGRDFKNPAALTGRYYPEALYELNLADWTVEVRWDFTKPRKKMFSYSSALSPNGELLAIGTEYDGVHLVDLKGNRDLCRFIDSKANMVPERRNLCFSANGRRLAGSATIGVSVWEIPQQ